MFHTTHWSLLAAATLDGEASGREALAALCRDYRPAVLSHVRRRGFAPEEAEDITQEFFLALLNSRAWQRADRARGRFRTFLLGMVEHVIAHRRERAGALKRGGGPGPVSLDALLEKGGEPPAAPEEETVRAFDRQWAVNMVSRALEAVTEEWTAQGRSHEMAVLRGFLPGGAAGLSYEEVGQELRLSPQAVKSAIHRLRQRFRAELRAVVARTVDAPHEIDDELRYLRRVLEQRST